MVYHKTSGSQAQIVGFLATLPMTAEAGRDKRAPSRLVATSATAHILNWDSVRNYPERDKRGENRADLKLIFPNGITGREIQVCGRGSRENLRPQACPGSLSRKLPNGIRIYGKVGRV